MKIGFDAKRITRNKTGLGNYGRFVVDSMAYYYPHNEYYLYTHRKGNEALYKQIASHANTFFRYPEGCFNQILPSLWRTKFLLSQLKRDEIQIYHGLSNELPLGIGKSGIPSVVTIHDLIFLRYPHLYHPIDRCIYHFKFKQACLEANRIIAVSQQTKEDIISFFRIPADKIKVIYQGCDSAFYQPASEEQKQQVQKKYALTTPYLIYIGSIEERKNLLTLVKAYELLNNKDIHLVAVGRRTPYLNLIETYIREHQLEGQVQILTDVQYADLPSLYQMASVFVYPSFFEGFGIPILEALASNTPVIAATGSCLEEAGGEGSLYTDPHNPNQLKDLIYEVLSHSTLADSMRKQGQIYAQRFSPDTLSAQMMHLYENL
ncbi:glycosyl transferase family 1 [Bacteroidia bacterium]|nr:glycosyl transferase family 1 [Bacteroidia bacterium]